MSQRTLRNLLLIGIAAMVVAVICLIMLHNLVPPKARNDSVDDITWDSILAQSSGASDAALSDIPDMTGSEEPTEEPSASPTPEPTEAPTPAPTEAPSVVSPPVLLEGGLVPYDSRWFTITQEPVEEIGWAKLIRGSKPGEPMKFQNISWEMDVRDAEDVHGTLNGTALSDDSIVGTGTLVQLYDAAGETVIDTAVVAVPGDVNGDGLVDAADLAIIQAAADTPGALGGVYLLAADLDGSGRVDASDIAAVTELVGS